VYSVCRDRGAGFTLLELMVAIGIAMVLMAMAVPIGKSLREGNRMMACGSNLKAIHQAMKLYSLDERGVPPSELAAGDDPSDLTMEPVGPGLWALYMTGYVGQQTTLHCAHAAAMQKTNPEYYRSYDGRDKKAGYDASGNLSALNQYRYLPYRGEDDTTSADYYRQLARGTGTTTLHDPTWQPDDNALVCWCDQHAESFTRSGEGQYQVLYWGGQVKVKPRTLFREAGRDAWRVWPDD